MSAQIIAINSRRLIPTIEEQREYREMIMVQDIMEAYIDEPAVLVGLAIQAAKDAMASDLSLEQCLQIADQIVFPELIPMSRRDV